MDHWKAAKKIVKYLQGNKDHMLIYRRTNSLEVICYSYLEYVGCIDSRKSTFGYIFILGGVIIS